jgi:hypothetical protein
MPQIDLFGYSLKIENWQLIGFLIFIQRIIFPYINNFINPKAKPEPKDYAKKDALYSPPLPINDKNPKVFFNVTIGGVSGFTKVVMEVRTVKGRGASVGSELSNAPNV